MKSFQTGERITPRVLTSTCGNPIEVPEPGRLLHSQVRRFAGCRTCTTHLRTLVRRRDDLEAAAISEVLVFRSSGEALRQHYADVPFAIVGDPTHELCAEFGVESSLRAPLDPRAWAVGLLGAIRNLPRPPTVPPWLNGALGLPADFVVAGKGTLLDYKYGEHAYDQWSVDELLARPTLPTLARPAPV